MTESDTIPMKVFYAGGQATVEVPRDAARFEADFTDGAIGIKYSTKNADPAQIFIEVRHGDTIGRAEFFRHALAFEFDIANPRVSQELPTIGPSPRWKVTLPE